MAKAHMPMHGRLFLLLLLIHLPTRSLSAIVQSCGFASLACKKYAGIRDFRQARDLQLHAEAPPSMLSRDSSSGPSPLQQIPNALTIARVAALPLLMASFYLPSTSSSYGPASIFAALSLTDFVDGYLARKLKAQSAFGAFLDPVADKLLVCVALTTLAGAMGPVVAVPASLIICREIAVSALREWMASCGARDDVAVGWSGKLKTAAQMVSLQALLLARAGALSAIAPRLRACGLATLYLACALTLSSGARLATRAAKKLRENDASASA